MAIRIIGGQWRHRVIPVRKDCVIRPTPNRVRETLFNWLQPFIKGARCLDAFAGSGALGIEALSRGALHVTFLDQDIKNILALKALGSLLKCSSTMQLLCASWPMVNLSKTNGFDIIFLDPPFHQGLIPVVLSLLEKYPCILPSTLLYIESFYREDIPLPAYWTVLKNQRAGQVRYQLLIRQESVQV
jgi:16S rRNA (guanine966-N2)-methyltransferase